MIHQQINCKGFVNWILLIFKRSYKVFNGVCRKTGGGANGRKQILNMQIRHVTSAVDYQCLSKNIGKHNEKF